MAFRTLTSLGGGLVDFFFLLLLFLFKVLFSLFKQDSDSELEYGKMLI